MTTALDIVKASLRKLHVLGRGEALDNDAAQDGLDALNNLLSSWSAEGGMVYASTDETFPLTGAQSYTIGSGGDFDTAVPLTINTAYATSGGLDYDMTEIGVEEYRSISLKQTGSIPDTFYYDYGYPLSTIYIYPVAPSGYSITLNSLKRLTEFSSLTDDFDLPPEYKRALIFNLAVELAPDYEKEASMTVMRIAKESKSNVFSANTRNNMPVMTSAYGLKQDGGWNIYKGTNV